MGATDLPADAFDTAKDMLNNMDKDLFDWMKPHVFEDNSDFTAWDDSHHNDWNDHKTDYMGDMGWPDLNNFDGSDFGWGDYHSNSRPMPTAWPQVGSDSWDHPWGGHLGSKGVESSSSDDLTDHMGWLSSLLPDTNDYDDAMTGSWSTDSWSLIPPGSWGSNGWDSNHMMTQTSSSFDFGKGPQIEDTKRPNAKGTKGKKKPKKGSQKGPDVGQIIGQF